MITRTTCRVCGGKLDEILSLGSIHPSDFLKPGEQPRPALPLDLMACRDCDLVQLRHTVAPDTMFRKYWYVSGTNETMVAELQDIVAEAKRRVGPLTAQDTVIDIGANDGTLLAQFGSKFGHPCRVAFEPAVNLYDTLREHAEILVADYFPEQLSGTSAKVITSIAMFYDVEDPHSFVQAVADRLAPDGIWILQFQDLGQMVDACAFDNIVHEHLTYYRLKDIDTLVKAHGLKVVDVAQRTINGGSLRVYVQHAEHTPQHAEAIIGRGHVAVQLQREATLDRDRLHRFAWEVTERKKQLLGLIQPILDSGQKVDWYGASTKSNTLLQYCGIDHTMVRCAVERNPAKVGRMLPGSGITVMSEDLWRTSGHQVTVVGIWQFREAVLAREAAYLAWGGTFIFPCPVVEVVSGAVTV
jgi:C-methyltransferase C-terminal domain/Putative zinc binding domain/Methyltransferase domain